jgi:hypothetical protein
MSIFDPGAEADEAEPEEPIASNLREAEPAVGRLDSNSRAVRSPLARRLSRGERAWRLFGTLGWLLLVVSLVIGLSGGFDGIARNVAQALRCLSAHPSLSTSSSHPPNMASSIRILGSGPAGRDTATLNTGSAGMLATPSPPGVVSITPSQNAMRYPLASTWSPDGQTLAILGSFIAPDSAGESSSLVDTYDVATGRLIQALSPGAILLTAAMQNPDTLRPVLLATECASGAATTTYTLQFSQIFWSAHYGRIALPFYLTPVEGSASPQSYGGLLDMFEDGSYAWAMLQPVSQSVFSPNISLRWDLTARVMTAIPTPTPALGYHWSADDTLVIDTPLSAQAPSSTTALGPVSDPSGAQLSIWQSGKVDYVTRPINSNNQQLISPGAYLYQAGGFGPGLAAWSPDGRYIVDPVATFTGRFEPPDIPAPSAQGLTDLGVAQAPLLPVRDAALQQALAALPNQSPDTYPEMLLAWRPDGRVLAAQLATTYGSPISPEQHVVTLYDCATGRQLATLTPAAPSATPQKDPSYLSWSPDGTRLLAFDGVSGVGTLWGSGDLPQ